MVVGMGASISSVVSFFFGKQEIRILMVGPNNSGKTTILYKLKLGTTTAPIPFATRSTIGYNIDTVDFKNIRYTVWDIGGGSAMPALWRNFYEDKRAVIFVFDSNEKDTEAISHAKKSLHNLLKSDELQDTILLVYANKQDIQTAMSSSELVEQLDLSSLENIPWHIQPVSAIRGNGLFEGLEWLTKKLIGKQRDIRNENN